MPAPVKYASLISVVLLLFAASCTKDKGLIEERLVITKQDLSIPTSYNIMAFDFYDVDHIFAVGYNGSAAKLFLTANGGVDWEEIPQPVFGGVSQVQSAVYMDADNLAVVANNKLYRSFDGGQSWAVVTEFGFPKAVFFACKTADEQLLYIENNNAQPNDVYTTPYYATIPTLLMTCPAPGNYFNIGHFNNNHVVFLSYDDYEEVRYINLNTLTYHTKPVWSTAYEYPMDGLMVADNILLARRQGKLSYLSGSNGTFPANPTYNYHDYDYAAAEDMGGYVIAVGEKTITSNLNEYWDEVLNTDGTGQQETFRRIKRIDGDAFYIAGNNGVFMKGTLR